MITLQNLIKSFGDVQAVRDISFEIPAGQVVGFLGPNGAGKSTTMRMITGFLKPTSGHILVDGIDVEKSPVEARQHIGYLPESAALYTDMVVVDYLMFMGRMKGMDRKFMRTRLEAVVAQCQLQSVIKRPIGDLSKGFRQRVGLAQALLNDPKVLILDEPTVGLDPNQIVEIRELIKTIGQSKTVMLSSHILPEVSATCQRVIIINQGKVVAQGSPEELMQKSSAKVTYRVVVRGDIQDVQKKLSQLPEFINLHVEASNDNVHALSLNCSSTKNLGEDIFRMAVNQGWSLSELVREQQTLENVFKDLTR